VATIGWVKIGLTTDTSGLAAGTKSAGTMLDGLAAKATAVGLAVAGAFAVKNVIASVTAMGAAASELANNTAKVETVFGSAAESVLAMSNRMSKSFGVAKNQTLDAAARFGLLAEGAGLSETAAAALSIQFVKLANDAGHFFDYSFEDTFTKLRSGLSGESEPLKDLGILMTEGTVKAKAYALGLATAGSELTELAKFQARSALITEGLAVAEGAAAREQKQFGSAVKEFWGRIDDLSASVGQAFAPALERVVGWANQFVGSIQGWIESTDIVEYVGRSIDSFIIAPMEAVINFVGEVNGALHGFGLGLQDIFLGALHTIAAVGKGITYILSLVGLVEKRPERLTDSITDEVKKKKPAKSSASPATVHNVASSQRFAGALEKDSSEARAAILASRDQWADAMAKGGVQGQIASNTSVTAMASVRSAAALEKMAGAVPSITPSPMADGGIGALGSKAALSDPYSSATGRKEGGSRVLEVNTSTMVEQLKKLVALAEIQTRLSQANSGLYGLATSLATLAGA
jgi:hypothetical protein